MPPKPKKQFQGTRFVGTQSHNCAWPGCTRRVGVRNWMCLPHQSTLPLDLRKKVVEAYGPPRKPYWSNVEAEVGAWIYRQNPGNYQKGLFKGTPTMSGLNK